MRIKRTQGPFGMEDRRILTRGLVMKDHIGERSKVEQLLVKAGIPLQSFSRRTEFKNGHLIYLDLSGAQEFPLADLGAFLDLEWFSFNGISWLRDLSFMHKGERKEPLLPALEQLSISHSGNGEEALDVGPLALLPNLREVWAQGTAVKNVGALRPIFARALKGRNKAETGHTYYQNSRRVMFSFHGTKMQWE